MTEAEFTRQVLELAKLRGWKSAHFRPAQTKRGWRTAVQGDGKGFPDLVLVRQREPKGVLVAELKVVKGVLRPEQTAWLIAFEAAGVPAFIWTPRDWGEIERILEKGP